MSTRKTNILNILCLLLTLTIMILQFTPFWQLDSKSVSINGLVWFPSDHKELIDYLMTELDGNFTMNGFGVVGFPILTLVLGAATFILCLMPDRRFLSGIIGTVFGSVSAVGYIINAAMRLGTNWQLHLVLCLAVAVLSLIGLLRHIADGKTA